jgi:hypothetical protein
MTASTWITLALDTVGIVAGVVLIVHAHRTVGRLRAAAAALTEAVHAQEHARTAREEFEVMVADFVRRVDGGEVVAVTTDGTVGALVVEPCGENALRIAVVPFAPTSTRH